MRRSTTRLTVFLLAVAGILVGTSTTWGADAFVVIVHKDNPIGTLSRIEASDLLLKKKAKWNDGEGVEPADREASSPIRGALSDTIHKRATSVIVRYWQRQIFTGREVPPPTHASDADMLTFVRGRRGAIGYVAASAVDASVKVVEITDD